MGFRSKSCKICALGDGTPLQQNLLEKIDYMIRNHAKSKDIIAMCKLEGFDISVSRITNHKRYHLLEEMLPLLPDLAIEDFEVEIETETNESLIKGLVEQYVESIKRQIQIATITKTLKDEAILTTSLNNLINTLTKSGITIVNQEQLNREIEQIKNYLD
ncbi:hypothetical protein [Geminocystis sp. GBBB08]|uniref:hypothetical protein n=1 Tax=Geminocystis sp. GBBB08 TaxID=2604140 RepID=UPI0027E26838|nr:hypothetical protein [Geminocystis sp. GBBB08]MBL1210678.1 hypothetical protein [Geminocystis sp. GBBB08]